MEEVIIIGHKNPDTDSVVSAIALAYLKNSIEKAERLPASPDPSCCHNRFVAARCGEVNEETALALSKANVEEPKLIENVEGKSVILVDHNEFSQAANGIEKAKILGIVDHHKINFSYPEPIYCHVEPLGSTSTIIAEMFFNSGIEMKREIALLLLAGILSDTVVFKSSTATEKDREIAEKLAAIAGIESMENFGIELKRAKASVRHLSAREILEKDFKEYEFGAAKVGIAQIEIVDFAEVNERREEILKEMETMLKERNYALLLLMVTNIIKGDTDLWCVGDVERVERAFNRRVENHSVYLEGVMSRKKDVVPKIQAVF